MTRLDQQRIYDKDTDTMAEWAQPPAERTDLEHASILRWEDDGGQAIEHAHPADHSTPEAAMRKKRPMSLPAKEVFG